MVKKNNKIEVVGKKERERKKKKKNMHLVDNFVPINFFK
jgi:hypothetical protein